MATSSQVRKVLVAENGRDVRNVVCNLLAGFCEGEVAQSLRVSLTSFSEMSFDVIMLDVKCCKRPETLESQIEVQPVLVGRVLVITAEAKSPVILDEIDRLWATHVSPQHFTKRLLTALRTLH